MLVTTASTKLCAGSFSHSLWLSEVLAVKQVYRWICREKFSVQFRDSPNLVLLKYNFSKCLYGYSIWLWSATGTCMLNRILENISLDKRIQSSCLKSGFKGALCSPPCTSDKSSEQQCSCSLNLFSGEVEFSQGSCRAMRLGLLLPWLLGETGGISPLLCWGWEQGGERPGFPGSDTDVLALGLWLLRCSQPPAPARSGSFHLCQEVILPCTLASSAGAALELHRTVQRPFSCFHSIPWQNSSGGSTEAELLCGKGSHWPGPPWVTPFTAGELWEGHKHLFRQLNRGADWGWECQSWTMSKLHCKINGCIAYRVEQDGEWGCRPSQANCPALLLQLCEWEW